MFDNVVKNVKSSTKFESIEKSAAELKSDLESVITYCSETMTNIGNQMMACRKEIKQAWKKLYNHLDMLENELEKSTHSEEKRAKTKLENIMQTSKTKLEQIKQFKTT